MKLYNCSFNIRKLIYIYIYIYIYISTKILNCYDNCERNRTRYIMIDQNYIWAVQMSGLELESVAIANANWVQSKPMLSIVFNWGSLYYYFKYKCVFYVHLDLERDNWTFIINYRW